MKYGAFARVAGRDFFNNENVPKSFFAVKRRVGWRLLKLPSSSPLKFAGELPLPPLLQDSRRRNLISFPKKEKNLVHIGHPRVMRGLPILFLLSRNDFNLYFFTFPSPFFPDTLISTSFPLHKPWGRGGNLETLFWMGSPSFPSSSPLGMKKQKFIR